MNRRLFLRTTSLALFGAALPLAAAPKRGKVVVTIFQRGAVDGLNMIVPHGERAYFAARPSIAVARSTVLDLDGFFGLHPSLAPLQPFWNDGALAVVHAAGSPDSTRSHFEAQDFMESGTPGVKTTRDGFLARALAARRGDASPLRAVAIAPSTPRILAGSNALSTEDVDRFARSRAVELFAAQYPGTFEAMDVLRKLPPAGVAYPRNPLGEALSQIARLIRGGVGLELAFAESGGWDTHAGQDAPLARNLAGFAEAIAAFARDLGSRMSDVTLVTTSEFGRTVRENGNRGTDHGHGTVMLVLGGAARGRKVHGKWPGLEREQLFEGRDLAVTTDFRDVFAEVLGANVFPGHAARRVGVA
jgi:uncharacterized protein (DUF1501 family)